MKSLLILVLALAVIWLWQGKRRAALADNPFIKGEGMSPRARRELLGHSQLSLNL